MTSPIILATDTDDLATAKRWIDSTREYIDIYKFGLEFYLKFGREVLSEVQREFGCEVFLDLKLHDIPNTVGAATAQVAMLKPRFLTVHASGGRAMIKAACESAPNTDITAVTILTSLSQEDISEIGLEGTTLTRATSLAKLATDSGARAIVCSPLEIESIRANLPEDISIITPGIRPKSSTKSDDQKRVMDPKSAIKAGSNFLVIGRPITAAPDVSLAAKIIYEEASL